MPLSDLTGFAQADLSGLLPLRQLAPSDQLVNLAATDVKRINGCKSSIRLSVVYPLRSTTPISSSVSPYNSYTSLSISLSVASI